MNSILESLQDASYLIGVLKKDSLLINNVEEIVNLLVECFDNTNKVLICGNGGSACDGMHFAEEFTGRFIKNRKALPVISLTDAAHLTCVSNDFGYDYVFQRGVEAYGLKNDVFIGLSTSGNSKNIIYAINQAKELNLKTVLFLGKSGGELKGVADVEVIVPGESTARIQELHMLLLHIIIENVERKLFPDLY